MFDAARLLDLATRRDGVERGAIGHRGRSLVALRRGKYARHRLPRPGDTDIAVDATLRAAALRAGRGGLRGRVVVEREDVRRKLREHRVPFEVCFVVDNSYSLQADRLVEAVKGLVFGVLADATAHGDRVSLVAFRSGVAEATVALRPTSSLRLASDRLAAIPLSGRTPLPGALREARQLFRRERVRRPTSLPVVVVVTDGLPNVSLARGGDPVRDCFDEVRALVRAGVRLVVVDASPAGQAREASCGRALAQAVDGVYFPLGELAADGSAGLLERLA